MPHSPRRAQVLTFGLGLAIFGCVPAGSGESDATSGAEAPVTPHYPGPCTVQIDDAIDGTVDEVRRFTYDASGHVLREEDDTDADGTPDIVITSTYDDQGHRTHTETDRGADGSVDESATFTFEDGRLVREETDEDGDGTPDSVHVLTYDDQGRLVREEYDDDGNGRTDRVQELSYDEGSEHPARREQGFERRTYEYDEAGHLTREVISSRTRRRRRYRVQSVVVYEYDPEGRRTLEEYQTPSGEVTTYNRYAYDARGSMVRVESDGDVTTTAITYDEAGNPLREEIDEVGDKRLETFSYDCF